MGDLTRDDIREIIDAALENFATTRLPEIEQGAMAHKIEFTFGFDCMNPNNREAVRQNLMFIDTLRKTNGEDIKENLDFISGVRQQARKGGEKLFLVAVGVFGGGFIIWFVSKVWPDGLKYFHP